VKDAEKSVAEEIADVSMARPHVVLLGAGASRQAFPHGERSGKFLPTMVDFFEIPSIADTLAAAHIPYSGRNFEDLYFELSNDPAKTMVREALEREIFDYFSGLELPDESTLFDSLVLSLRPKTSSLPSTGIHFSSRRSGATATSAAPLGSSSFMETFLPVTARPIEYTVCVAPRAHDAASSSFP